MNSMIFFCVCDYARICVVNPLCMRQLKRRSDWWTISISKVAHNNTRWNHFQKAYAFPSQLLPSTSFAGQFHYLSIATLPVTATSSIVSAVLRIFGARRPIKITTSPLLIDLNTFMASSCFIPCNDLPFTTRISSPAHRDNKKTQQNKQMNKN